MITISHTVGVNCGDSSAASKSARRNRAARAGILSGTSSYGVFLIVICRAYFKRLAVGQWRTQKNATRVGALGPPVTCLNSNDVNPIIHGLLC
ncbi:hypothetical protein Y032_0039g24 [Ancylostoma ceylanicum]|uniref:Uncharacterized protein n=1 Tax=Ancylostoma ceylanicum TaxID=53326 RepID=A0A016UIZ3_9BILA|nr:hypothetical protein Y032_0039g24 [Ancylostoma ceylanicum]